MKGQEEGWNMILTAAQHHSFAYHWTKYGLNQFNYINECIVKMCIDF